MFSRELLALSCVQGSHEKHLLLVCAAQTDAVFVKNESEGGRKTWLWAVSTVRSSTSYVTSQIAGFQALQSKRTYQLTFFLGEVYYLYVFHSSSFNTPSVF